MSVQVSGWVKATAATKGELSAGQLSRGDLKALSDEALMQQLQNGNEDAIGVLFDRYYKIVLRIARRVVRDPGEAEDLLQEVFFEIYRVADRFDPVKGRAKSWVLQLAYHRSLNRRRYLELRKMYDREQISQLDVLESYYSPNGGNRLNPEELACLLREGLETLNREQRETLKLACFEGLPLNEIAQRTRKSLVSVQHHYYRGLKKLKDFLQDRNSSLVSRVMR